MDLGLAGVALDTDGMDVALHALGGFRGAFTRQARDEFSGHLDRGDHLVLGVAGMDVATHEGHDGAVGAEGLVFDLAALAAVHGVGNDGAELFDVEVLDALADFFIGGEGDLHQTVFPFGVLVDEGQGLQDFGDAGLVIGAQQGGSVGGNDGFTDALGQIRVLACQDFPAFLGQIDVAALIVLVEGGHNVFAADFGVSVHV